MFGLPVTLASIGAAERSAEEAEVFDGTMPGAWSGADFLCDDDDEPSMSSRLRAPCTLAGGGLGACERAAKL